MRQLVLSNVTRKKEGKNTNITRIIWRIVSRGRKERKKKKSFQRNFCGINNVKHDETFHTENEGIS
jgi:hypothetical protein